MYDFFFFWGGGGVILSVERKKMWAENKYLYISFHRDSI